MTKSFFQKNIVTGLGICFIIIGITIMVLFMFGIISATYCICGMAVVLFALLSIAYITHDDKAELEARERAREYAPTTSTYQYNPGPGMITALVMFGT